MPAQEKTEQQAGREQTGQQQTERQETALRALLIGIDHYPPNRVSAGRYPSLNGCINDVERVERYLLDTFGEDSCQITKLTSRLLSDTGDQQLPTYENIVTAMKRLALKTPMGARVLIHYSGHGGRTPTRYPEAKGEHAVDEALVPMDIGYCEDRYLRDIELAQLLSDMVDRGLRVILVLDSCHSGGATRLAKIAAPRGIGIIDTIPRRDLSLVAPRDRLIATWQRLRRTRRALGAACGWLPEPKGYVVLAACRQHEAAWECSDEGLPCGGLFTHWLLDSLRHLGPEATMRQLHDRTMAKVRGELPSQTPQLEGESSWTLISKTRSFGSKEPGRRGISVLDIDVKGHRVQLGIGAVHGVQRGAQLAIYPAEALQQAGEREAPAGSRKTVVEISECGAGESWALLPDDTDSSALDTADQALLLSPGPLRLQSRVQLLAGWQPQPVRDALELVRRAAEKASSGFLELVPEDTVAELQVAVTGDPDHQLRYEIRDRSGVPLPNLHPPLAVGVEGAERLIKRLIHLARYQHVRQLSNPDTSSSPGMLDLELCRWPARCPKDQRPQERVPLQSPGNTPEVAVGEKLCLWVTNTGSWPLEVTIFDLQPDWGISQVYPTSRDGLTFEPGKEEPILLEAVLPDGYQRGTDVVLVFGTRESTSYRWLEMAALDQPPIRKPVRRSPRNLLEQLQLALAVAEPTTRTLIRPARAEAEPEWEVASLEVTVVR